MADLAELTLKIHQQTHRAVLVSDDDNAEKAVWLPLSQIEVSLRRDGFADVLVPEWLAKERGLV